MLSASKPWKSWPREHQCSWVNVIFKQNEIFLFLYAHLLAFFWQSGNENPNTLNYILYNQSLSHPLFIWELYMFPETVSFRGVFFLCKGLCFSSIIIILFRYYMLHFKSLLSDYQYLLTLEIIFRREDFKEITIWRFRVNVKPHVCFFIIPLVSKLLKYTFEYKNILFKNSALCKLLHLWKCDERITIMMSQGVFISQQCLCTLDHWHNNTGTIEKVSAFS